MIVTLTKEYRFEAAHHLPRVPAGHKCARMHGHSYRVTLEVKGSIHPETGWLIDYGVIDDAWAPLQLRFDHHTLNEIPGLENSTSENLCVFIWNALRPQLPPLSAVTVSETHDSTCTYRGP
jgi:6-pyruvoyltetrahydropterin/6-carboxytetrahydropterin synthase